MDLSPIVLAHEAPFALGPIEVRPSTRELCSAGRTMIVEPRVMQLLVALHRADGGVVSKDDLGHLCWSGRIVGEDAINRVVSRLRHDLAKVAGDSLRIETITKVGYRLNSAHRDSELTMSATGPLTHSRAVDRRRLLIAGGGLAGAAALGALVLRGLNADRLPPEAEDLIRQGEAALNADTIDQYANAAAHFRQAAEIAPDRAEPWGLLAIAYRLQSLTAPQDQAVRLGQRATDASRRALSLDPDNGDAVGANVWGRPIVRQLARVRACQPRSLQTLPG